MIDNRLFDPENCIRFKKVPYWIVDGEKYELFIDDYGYIAYQDKKGRWHIVGEAFIIMED